MNNNDNQLYQSLMMGDFSGEGDLIQLITDDEDENGQKTKTTPKKYLFFPSETPFCFPE